MTRIRRFLGAVAITCAAASTGQGLAAAEGSSGLPYDDPYAHGGITLCDKDLHPITEGDVHQRPFVWRAVSSVAAPDGYRGDRRSATLVAYQVRPDTYASDFNGDQLTGTSAYTNPDVPMAQATSSDMSFADFMATDPPQYQGKFQLRIYFTAPGLTATTTSYPAGLIQVTGDRWKLLDAANASCSAGDAVSDEVDPFLKTGGDSSKVTMAPPAPPWASATASSKPSSAVGGSNSEPTSRVSAHSSSRSTSSNAGEASPAGGAASPPPSQVRAAGVRTGVHVSWPLIGLAAATAVGGGAYLYRLRRRT